MTGAIQSSGGASQLANTSRTEIVGAIDDALRMLAAIIDARGKRGLRLVVLLDRLEAERERSAAATSRLDEIRRKYLAPAQDSAAGR